ncbi:YhgE/Pip family protein [Spirillospora sp. CA-294931]|uniref:YhgE/Pip family protein n=1 Tax=Spirillospora sp. CA-294931 TaxID=3240042 RepID=UPI003D8FA8F9
MRLPVLSTGGLELRRFLRNPLTLIAVVGLMLLPLLYAGLYLWSFWDPYARLKHVPVALVVQDRPAKADGRTVNAGAELAKELKKRQVFDWRTVSEERARQGVRDGDYYMALTIPRDFSSRIASPSGDGRPSAAGLKLQLNDANNYVIGTLAQAAFKEISAAAAGDAVRGYLDQIFISFGKLHGKLGEAADGAGKLADGSGQARDGAGKLKGGIDQAHDGSAKLTSGLGTLREGADKVAEGNRQLAGGTRRLATAVDRAGDVVVPLLRTHAPDIRRAALLVADGADLLADGAGKLPAETEAAVKRAEQARDDLARHLDQYPEIPPDVARRLTDAADQVVAVARKVDGYIDAHVTELREIAANARTVERIACKIAKDAPALAGKVESARRNIDRLDAGAQRLASGSAQLGTGAGKLLSGSSTLTSGLGTLSDGAVTLESALGQIADGNQDLAAGLKDGARQVPAYGKAERDARADMMSSPVRLASTTDNKAPNYGTGFAPFFVTLALWVGGMLIFMLLRPVSPRAQASTAPAWRVALAGWLPAAAIGAGQVLIVLAVLHFSLGLQAARWPGLIAFLCLTAAAFMAVIQWANARFGPLGRVVALALLMLQLTSAAGTYPIETSPVFFQAIRPFLPMSWAVDAVRHLIGGGSLSPVWQGCAVLAAFLAGGLALTALAVRQNRVWTMKRLHPALKL